VTLHEGVDVPRDLARVHAPIRVEHDDEVPGRGIEADAQRIALAPPMIREDLYVWTQRASDGHSFIRRAAIDQDHLVHAAQPLEHPRDVLFLVARRDHHADERPEPVARRPPGSPTLDAPQAAAGKTQFRRVNGAHEDPSEG